ncbi:hypothetical protein B0H63DRAFT_475346 [Podospora didyma]|uniref:Ubiquitin carboxyl-terminal hydrolase n=1 Tax=Podospora didyma TaxID=330526 RepID=A0AAE0NH09_9PEZI|nr:hypothetical protein B0H63DRAFT_475346 [Podospora didyma]
MAGSTTVLDHAGSMPPTNGQNFVPFHGGPAARGGGGGGGEPGEPGGTGKRRALAHIVDVVSVTVDLDPHAPIEKVLQTAETYFKQAESANTFGRPDLALKDFIRTNIIVTDVIKKNKTWPALQSDHKAQWERYQRLVRKVNAKHPEYEKIKAAIKADNVKSGVQPTTIRLATASDSIEPPRPRPDIFLADSSANDGGIKTNGAVANGDVKNGETRENSATHRQPPPPPPHRSKPVVHPKPQALHGNALQTAGAGGQSSKMSNDLLQRFANLRSPSASPGQDPRIRTQPIPSSQMQVTQDSAVSQRPSALLAGASTDMPRLPDAIYNPARGTVSSEAAELPSSAPRAMFTRTNSAASVPGPPKITKATQSDEYFVTAQTFDSTASRRKRTKPNIPEGALITVEDLNMFMRDDDVLILLIDIRSREEFDEGHIFTQNIVCVEGEVLTRENISAEQIEDSMVIASAAEQRLFYTRHDFDLVVFYDQETERIFTVSDNPQKKAVRGLYNALTLYDFKEGPKPKLKLLRGGLNAWTDVFGQQSLKQGSSAAMNSQLHLPPRKPVAKIPFLNRRPAWVRPIQDPEEARRWEQSVHDIINMSPIRTTEDFLRRFPAISPTQESMVSPATGHARQSHEEILFSSLPGPPAVPPPTVPRRSYSGLAEDKNAADMLSSRKASLISGAGHRRYRTGLENPGVHCFANSSLQAIFATPGFSRDLVKECWNDRYQIPGKENERFKNPQLLIKFIGALCRWLDEGTKEYMSAGTLMEYIKSIHGRTPDGKQKPDRDVFGGSSQQDASEFMFFIMDVIDDETNTRRNRKRDFRKEYKRGDGTIVQNALHFWQTHSQSSDSIIDRYFRGLDVFITRCRSPSCQEEIRNFQVSDWYIARFDAEVQDTDLETLLSNGQEWENMPDLRCEKCNSLGRSRVHKFARLPDRLVICISRFKGAPGSKAASKNNAKVRFPIRNLDLTPYMADPDPNMLQTQDHHFAGRMMYDCYAVTIHKGREMSSGHYYSFVQDDQSKDPTDWFCVNDTHVARVKIDSGLSADMTEKMYKDDNASAYMVFYKRQGT